MKTLRDFLLTVEFSENFTRTASFAYEFWKIYWMKESCVCRFSSVWDEVVSEIAIEERER